MATTLAVLAALWTTATALSLGQSYDGGNAFDVCYTDDCIATGSRVKATMNEYVDPCVNFYQFTCGGYIDSHPVPEGGTWTGPQRDLIGIARTNQIKFLEGTNVPTFDAETKIKSVYKQCVDTDSRNNQTGQQVLPVLQQTINGWPLLGASWNPNTFNLMDAMAASQQYLIEPILGVTVDSKATNITSNELFLKTGIFFASQDDLMGADRQDHIDVYLDYMATVTELILRDVGSPISVEQLNNTFAAIVDLEIQLIMGGTTLPSELNLEVPLAVVNGQFMTSSSLNLTVFLNKCLALANVPLAVTESTLVGSQLNLTYWSNLDGVLSGVERQGDAGKVVLANYLGWKIISTMVDALPTEYTSVSAQYEVARQIELRKRGINIELTALNVGCADTTITVLPLAGAALYVRDIMPPDPKSEGIVLTARVKDGFRELILDATWMDEDTRSFALFKLDALFSIVAYPDVVKNNLPAVDQVYGKLVVGDSYYQSRLNSRLFVNRARLGRLPITNIRNDPLFEYDTTVINAFNYIDRNGIYILAGIMQGYFFDPRHPAYLNFGSLGYILGHEITHSFDDAGSLYDDQGNLRNWWNEETFVLFNRRADAMVAQYSNYTTQFGNVDGEKTLGENIADNGGMKAAYRGYKNLQTTNGRLDQSLPGLQKYTNDQMFFIGFGQTWCENLGPELEKLLYEEDVHSFGRFRTNGVVVNVPEFAEAFHCPLGSPMNPPVKNVVW